MFSFSVRQGCLSVSEYLVGNYRDQRNLVFDTGELMYRLKGVWNPIVLLLNGCNFIPVGYFLLRCNLFNVYLFFYAVSVSLADVQ